MEVLLKKLTSTAKVPERGSDYAAGYDLFADLSEKVEIAPHETLMIGTGIATLEVFLPVPVFLQKKDFAPETA